ncbi:MAG: GNAT family N-acetyltransferase [Nanoarchaeota archaeon]
MSKSRKIKLEGKRIILRGLRREDASDLVAIANDSEIAKYTPIPFPFLPEHAKKLIDGTRASINNDKAYFLGIEFTEKIIGMAGLQRVDRTKRTAEAGYWIGKDYRNQGFATEALDLVLDFGFMTENLQKIWGRVTENNAPSIKILEKRGFSLSGRVPSSREIEGLSVDDRIYELTSQQYLGSSQKLCS